jgi:hypothetical protein
MATQITVLKLHDPINIEHDFFAEGRKFKDVLKEISIEPGFSRGFWGLEDEDPAVVRVFVNWNSSDGTGSEYVTLTFHWQNLQKCLLNTAQ